MDEEEPIRESITCPQCGRTSWNPTDVREGYCGACRDWTSGVPVNELMELVRGEAGMLCAIAECPQCGAAVLRKLDGENVTGCASHTPIPQTGDG